MRVNCSLLWIRRGHFGIEHARSMGELMEQSASIGQVSWWFSHNLPPASPESLVIGNFTVRKGRWFWPMGVPESSLGSTPQTSHSASSEVGRHDVPEANAFGTWIGRAAAVQDLSCRLRLLPPGRPST
jgi:hypothetical protein